MRKLGDYIEIHQQSKKKKQTKDNKNQGSSIGGSIRTGGNIRVYGADTAGTGIC